MQRFTVSHTTIGSGLVELADKRLITAKECSGSVIVLVGVVVDRVICGARNRRLAAPLIGPPDILYQTQ